MPLSKPVRLDPLQRIVNVGWGKRADFVIFRFRNPLLGGNVDSDQRQNLIRVNIDPVSQSIDETGMRVGWFEALFVPSEPNDTGYNYRPDVDWLRMYGQTGLAGYREDIFIADLRLIRQQTSSKRIAIYSANLNGREHPFNGSVTLMAQAFLGGAIVETNGDDRVTGSGQLVQTRSLVAAVDGRTFGGGPGQLLAYFELSTLSFMAA